MLSKMSGSSWQLLTILFGILNICSTTTANSNSLNTDIDQNIGPSIIPSKSEIILQNGQNFTIFCRSNTPIQFKQQDILIDTAGSPFNKTQRNVTSIDLMYKYEIALDLYNVDQFAVGYYACFDDTLNRSIVLNKVLEEPTDTEHVSYIYIYVNGTEMLFTPMSEFVRSRSDSKVIIECRPTTPDVNVTLEASYKIAEFKYSPKIGFSLRLPCRPSYSCKAKLGNRNTTKQVRCNKVIDPPKPTITSLSNKFLRGENFSLNCTIPVGKNSAVQLIWKTPSSVDMKDVTNETNEHEVLNGKLYLNISIVNATEKHAGNYTCVSRNRDTENSQVYEKIYKGEKGYIYLTKDVNSPDIYTNEKIFSARFNIDAYPEPTLSLTKDNNLTDLLVANPKKFFIFSKMLRIKNLSIQDAGNYTLKATNAYATESLVYDIRPKAIPIVNFGSNNNSYYLQGTVATLQCEATGYPLPNIKWIFSNDKNETQSLVADSTQQTVIKITSFLRIPIHATGIITCRAENEKGVTPVSKKIFVYEVPGGFGITNSDTWYPENENVTKKCFASLYDFDNVTWFHDEDIQPVNITYTQTQFSHVAILNIYDISLDDEGIYTCAGYKNGVIYENYTINITIAARQLPVIMSPIKDSDVEVNPYQHCRLSCQANGVPRPTFTWYKDGEILENSSIIEILTDYLDDYTTVNSTVDIKQALEEYKGVYECVATSRGATQKRSYNLKLNEKAANTSVYLSIIGAIVIVAILLIMYLMWKVRKEKQFRKELAAAGLLYFKEGVTRSINPDLGIDEQAELLPYDEKFEFPAEKLILGKQLGAGAFGVVYKAEARGIINAEETTTVAVKMVKKTADNMYIKALASELKIMVHLGKHVNIVNLLGACTKNVGKRELIVIVEYCMFGNIHNYMQKHREVFIDQLTDNKEKNFGRINKGFSCSSGSSGMHSDYFGSNHTQETDHTFVNTVNTNRSTRKVSDTGYVQPEWRSNYESDYSYDGRTPRPLTSRDLLAWAFQIARGMEYLASRKVLHGDLAARNVLLAEDNIVKICDFGLARSIYKNDEYKKQENSPLPIKWLAIECMTDKIFSTQSDVWSFGVVLWELFSLAKTPYPNVSPMHLIQWLSDGHRLEKPRYADDRLYGVMQRCWEQKPSSRPNFSQLQEILGSFLEDNVRNHYVDLNSPYMDMNVKQDGQEDYLARMATPDYNRLVTPSPHHYVNDTRSFFPPTPTQLAHDDEGYLQMSPATNHNIFSPRSSSTKFDFDARKLNQRVTEPNSMGSELTPMLTINNLPTRGGSESDHDGNVSPYLNMYPRIKEEADDVFEMKQNNHKNVQNFHNSAVTNPTYITMDSDLEKKPHNTTNNYINMNVPNGLVK